MKRKVKMKFVAIICACIMCIGMTLVVSADTRAACTHPNINRYGSTVSSWSGSHTVTFSASQGPQQCTYSHWVEVVSFVCADCGYVIGTDTYQYEKHALCGVDY